EWEWALVVFFFFQAEDGIRYWSVTGVQTCALPICLSYLTTKQQDSCGLVTFDEDVRQVIPPRASTQHMDAVVKALHVSNPKAKRSEERRVGKEWRSRWARYH